MSVSPRIVFTRFVSADSPKLQPWLSHSRRLLSVNGHAAPGVDSGLHDAVLVWQLVSGNNRQLGRSIRVHSSFDSALEEATRVRSQADRIIVSMVSEDLRGVYGWYGSIDGEPVMTCARWYNTERDRARSLQLAVPSLAAAELLAGSRLIDPALMHGVL